MPATKPVTPQKAAQIKQLADQGLSKRTIAKVTNTSRNTIDKYVVFDEGRSAPLASLKANMSSLLHELLGSAMSLQSKLLVSLNGEDVRAMSTSDKRQLMRDTSIVLGTVFDKIRLQDGKSTSNNSHEIQLRSVHKALNFAPACSGSKGKPTKVAEA